MTRAALVASIVTASSFSPDQNSTYLILNQQAGYRIEVKDSAMSETGH
jgi:hypothetical protein